MGFVVLVFLSIIEVGFIYWVFVSVIMVCLRFIIMGWYVLRCCVIVVFFVWGYVNEMFFVVFILRLNINKNWNNL